MIGAIQRVVIRGLNHLVQGESWAQERLQQRAGANLMVEAGRFKLSLTIDEKGLFRQCDTRSAPDVTLTLPADSILNVVADREKLFASVKLDGSADIAETLAFVFRNLRWDAEGDLAEVIGDIPAHRLAQVGKGALSGLQTTMAKITENVTEFVAEDSGYLISDQEAAIFNVELSRLCDDLAHLEKRILAL